MPTTSRGGPRAQPDLHLIRLDHAFRWVLACIEEVDEVDPTSRLGLLPGQSEPINPPPRPVLTGPEFEQFKSAVMPHRLSLPPPLPPQAKLWPVPDTDFLKAMLLHRQNQGSQAENGVLRACRVHDWLLKAFGDQRLDAWAEAWIEPRDGSCAICLGSGRPIEPLMWGRLLIDYERAMAVSPDDDHHEELGVTIVGRLVFHEILVCSRNLGEEFKTIERTQLPIAVNFTVGEDGDDNCEISWEGRSIAVKLKGRERVNRAMRALAILLRNPDRGIAYQLLDGFMHRDSDTKKQSEEDRKATRDLRQEIKPYSEKLFRQTISLDAAHHKLDVILANKKHEGTSLRVWAEWSPHYRQAVDDALLKPTKFHDLIVEDVRETISHGVNAIREVGADAAADYLNTRIDKRKSVVRFATSALSGGSRRRVRLTRRR
jgi:hypothetical protein